MNYVYARKTLIEGNNTAGNGRRGDRLKEQNATRAGYVSSDAGNHRPGGKKGNQVAALSRGPWTTSPTSVKALEVRSRRDPRCGPSSGERRSEDELPPGRDLWLDRGNGRSGRDHFGRAAWTHQSGMVEGFGRPSKRETVQRRAAVWRSQAACFGMERESVATGGAGRGPFKSSFRRRDETARRSSRPRPENPQRTNLCLSFCVPSLPRA